MLPYRPTDEAFDNVRKEGVVGLAALARAYRKARHER